MSKKTGGVAGGYVDGFFVKSDEVVAEGAKLQPKEVFRGALKSNCGDLANYLEPVGKCQILHIHPSTGSG